MVGDERKSKIHFGFSKLTPHVLALLCKTKSLIRSTIFLFLYSFSLINAAPQFYSQAFGTKVRISSFILKDSLKAYQIFFDCFFIYNLRQSWPGLVSAEWAPTNLVPHCFGKVVRGVPGAIKKRNKTTLLEPHSEQSTRSSYGCHYYPDPRSHCRSSGGTRSRY